MSGALPSERRRLELEQLRRLRVASLVEATTLLLLLGAAVPLKHLAGWPTGVAVMGPVHGLAFLAYIWTALETAAGGGWSRTETARVLVVAFLPFGGFTILPLLGRKMARIAGAGAWAA